MANPRILIVEDDPLVAMELQSIVEEEFSAKALISRSVASAKKLIEAPIDLALLDIEVIDGKTFEVAMLLKLREVPFMFLSGSDRAKVPDQLQDAPFIAKPCSPQELVEHISRVIPGPSI